MNTWTARRSFSALMRGMTVSRSFLVLWRTQRDAGREMAERITTVSPIMVAPYESGELTMSDESASTGTEAISSRLLNSRRER